MMFNRQNLTGAVLILLTVVLDVFKLCLFVLQNVMMAVFRVVNGRFFLGFSLSVGIISASVKDVLRKSHLLT